MQCRNCGTEIADKALICYRCGVPTTEAKYQPAIVRDRRSPPRTLIAVVVLLLLVLAAYFLLHSSSL